MHKLIKESIKSTHVFLITVLTVVSIVFIMAYQVHQSYKQIWDSASIVNRNILLVVANILENNFRTAIMSLEGTKEKLSQLKNNQDSDWFIENLFYDLSNYSVFGAELILDKDGNVLHSSPGFSENVVDPNKNLAHLEYFYQHKNNADQGNADLGVFLGKPFISRVDNKPRIPISIRYDDENGNFAGVISQTLKISEINKMFSYL